MRSERHAGSIIMTVTQLKLLIIYSTGMLLGQLLFKLAANGPGGAAERPFVDKALGILLNGYFITAAALYLLLSVMWVWILQLAPISRAYPFVAINFALVAIMGVVFFSERLAPLNWAGVALIFLGVVLVTLGD